MKSSSKNKMEVDDISRETQRLVKDSHVRLPYHKPKQKSLKDFLNRQKITKEYQASITGSKKLLQKAWELIEHKEQNVEKFYSEDCTHSEENPLSTNDNTQAENNICLDSDDSNHELASKENNKIVLSESSDDEENYLKNPAVESSELLSSDDEENSRLGTSLHSKESPSKEEDNDSLTNDINSTNSDDDDIFETKDNEIKKDKSIINNQFIDDEAEESELDSSDDEENVPDIINDSGEEEEFSAKKKRRLIVLSESSDEDETDREIKLTADDFIPISNEPETNISTQQLMDLCSGQFQTQQSESQEGDDDQESEDDFDSEVPVNDIDKEDKIEDDNNESANENDNEMLKLTSAKDYFDDEAELSESDWSSDDEDHLMDNIDNLEEEAGDKDKLDEDIVKDGLDKIYMRQLLDDDQQQVTALKEMLLEDGDLHSDSSRKRKFQWDVADENDASFKRPLFSDNESEEDNDDFSDDEKAEQWRKERFKRESYLSRKNNSEDEEENNIDEDSSNNLQAFVSVVKKTHVVKYQKVEIKNLADTIDIDQNDDSMQINNTTINDCDKSSSSTITIKTDSTTKFDIMNKNDIVDLKLPYVIASKPNKFVKGSFMKRNTDKLSSTLLYINKKSTNINDEINGNNFDEKSEMKSLSTITSKAGSNPFAYLLRNDQKVELKNPTTNVEKKENFSQSNSVQSIPKPQIKSHKQMNSILKQLD